MNILLEATIVRHIPVLTFTPTSAQACPLIFFIPGYGGKKESALSLGYQLASRGFFVVSFDPWLHGERYDPRLDHAADPVVGGIYPPETGLDTGALFFQIINHCQADVASLLDHYSGDGRWDGNRCGVTGLSMGGCASYLIFANLPQIQAAVPMIGIPSFTQRWLDILDECTFSNAAWATALAQVHEATAQQIDFIRQIDPVEKLLNATPRALLIMNNDFDTDQPKHYAVNLYRQLLPHYAATPDRLRLNIYPAGHVVTPQMEQDAVEWFERWLHETGD